MSRNGNTGNGKANLKKKCRSTRGETLVEVLVGILFVGLASSFFLSMVTVSRKINENTRKADTLFYQAMSQLERFKADGEAVQKKEGTVTVTTGMEKSVSQDYKVTVYYGDDMTAYQAEAGAEDGT